MINCTLVQAFFEEGCLSTFSRSLCPYFEAAYKINYRTEVGENRVRPFHFVHTFRRCLLKGKTKHCE